MALRMNPDADMSYRQRRRLRPVGDRLPRGANRVLMVLVTFKYDFTMQDSTVMDVSKAIVAATGGSIKAAMHGRRQISFVVPTSLATAQLKERIAHTLDAGGIENAWVMTAPTDIVARDVLDPLADRVGQAWNAVRQAGKPFDRRPTREQILARAGPDPVGAIKAGLKAKAS